MNFSIFLSRDPDCGKWCVAAWPGPGAGELARKSMERERGQPQTGGRILQNFEASPRPSQSSTHTNHILQSPMMIEAEYCFAHNVIKLLPPF